MVVVEAPGIEFRGYLPCLLRNIAEYDVGNEPTPKPSDGSLRHITGVMDTSSTSVSSRAQPKVIRGVGADAQSVRCPGCRGPWAGAGAVIKPHRPCCTRSHAATGSKPGSWVASWHDRQSTAPAVRTVPPALAWASPPVWHAWQWT